MTLFTQTQIEQALASYIDPHLQQNLLMTKAIRNIRTDDANVIIDIVLGYPVAVYKELMIADIKAHLAATVNMTQVEINLTWKLDSHAIQQGLQPLRNIKNVIAVASGKGGVGKSTIAVNLALALAAEGARVGILDADIYGPSQPMMLGVSQQNPVSKDSKSLEPVISYNIQSMSIGYLIEQDTPMIWRGPMVTSALQQLLNDTNWQDVDYLIIDLPPGTGDIQLTLSQKIPVSGAIIVSTPQDIALLDARKALAMFQKVRVPVLGVIENMALHTCSQCGHEESIFGAGGGEKMAEQYNIDLLGSLPLDIQIRQHADQGKPTVVADPTGKIAGLYREIARKMAAKLSLQAKNLTSKFPRIVIE